MTQVVAFTTIIRDKVEQVVVGDVFWMFLHECACCFPQRWDRAFKLEQRNGPAFTRQLLVDNFA